MCYFHLVKMRGRLKVEGGRKFTLLILEISVERQYTKRLNVERKIFLTPFRLLGVQRRAIANLFVMHSLLEQS